MKDITGYDTYEKYRQNKWPIETFRIKPDTLDANVLGFKEMECPKNFVNNCDPKLPFVCIAGRNKNKCARVPMAFETDPGCFAYCNTFKK